MICDDRKTVVSHRYGMNVLHGTMKGCVRWFECVSWYDWMVLVKRCDMPSDTEAGDCGGLQANSKALPASQSINCHCTQYHHTAHWCMCITTTISIAIPRIPAQYRGIAGVSSQFFNSLDQRVIALLYWNRADTAAVQSEPSPWVSIQFGLFQHLCCVTISHSLAASNTSTM